MGARFWFITICSLALFFSCRKQNAQTRWLKGEWDLVKYYHIAYDGTTISTDNAKGVLRLIGDPKSKSGELDLSISYELQGKKYSLNRLGTYECISYDSIHFTIDKKQYKGNVIRRSKKDLFWTTNISNDPWDGSVWRKR